MATYDVTGVWLNGEHLIIDDAHLHTVDGMRTATWEVDLEGAHILEQHVNERVALKVATAEGHEAEGEARVTDPGRHDERTKVYYGVRFEGLTPLREVR